MQPDVSVVIPTYNRLYLLDRAIHSCLADARNYNVEIVVVDDGSTDGTSNWVRAQTDSRVRLIQQQHDGAQKARNLGLRAVTARYVRFLDSDDWLGEGATLRQVATLDQTGADVAYGDAMNVFEGSDRTFPGDSIGPVNDMVASLLGDKWVAPFSYLYRSDTLAFTEWKPELSACQDFDFVLGIALAGGRFVYVPAMTGYYFHHSGERTSRRNRDAWRSSKMNILSRAAATLSIRNGWTSARRTAIATTLHNLAKDHIATDIDGFRQCLALIDQICPDFIPRQRLRRYLCRLLGLERTELLLQARHSILSK